MNKVHLNSHNIINAGNNSIQPEVFTKYLKLDDEIYILKIQKINSSQISIKCENKYDYLSLYCYSIILTYEEFCKIARTFRLFDNIDEIFNTIKNLFKGVNFSYNNELVNNLNMNNNFNNMNNMINNPNSMNNMNNNFINNNFNNNIIQINNNINNMNNNACK